MISKNLPKLREHLNSRSSFKVGTIWYAYVVLTVAVLGYMLFQDTSELLAKNYEGYPSEFLNIFGWGMSIGMVVLAVVLSLLPWKNEAPFDEFNEKDLVHHAGPPVRTGWPHIGQEHSACPRGKILPNWWCTLLHREQKQVFPMRTEPYRLITRSDFDGLVSAAMLRDIGVVDAVMFVHPKDVQDGKVHVDKDDMLVNLPYVATAGQVFDYQAPGSRVLPRVGYSNLVMGVGEASVSRVIYDHFGGESRFPHFSPALMAAVDKAGSASYTLADVLHPRDWTLLGFLADPRTGLGRFHDFRISNLQLMMMLVDACRSMDIGRILALPDVAERVRCYHEHESKAIEQLRRCAHVQGNTVVLDMRNESIIYAANRFLVYALFPNCTMSLHVMWGREKANTVFALGRSIFNTASTIDIGDLCTRFGGGGHQTTRSEERRVGKECRSRWSPYH